MESANKSYLARLFFWSPRKASKGKTVIEYLPDADEIERSPVPPLAQGTMHVLIACVLAFGVWASLAQLDQVVLAQGSLINPLPNIVVQPLESSIIQSVPVRVGQVVKKGDVLATLDATFIQADENQLRHKLDSLETQAQGLSQELSGQPASNPSLATEDDQLQASLIAERRANYRAQQSKLAETSAKLRAALATNRNDQRQVASRLKSIKELESMQEKMVAQKFGAPMQLLEAQQRSKEVERDLDLVVSREQEILRELAAFEAEKIAFEKGWRQKTMEELLTISRERDALKEQLLKADKRHRLVTLVAPEDAIVLDIAKLSPGAIVKEAETFFTLVPLNVKLEAEVRVDASDVGYIRMDHPVHLKISAFPFQRHGTLDGKVRTVSPDAFRRDNASQGAAETYYMSRITLESTELKSMLEGARLLPGMSLTAEIVVNKKSIISYLAWPITKGLDEAAREPR
ncbi:HlyD family type I secretion periplasmic adaptor subunit [Rhodoferax aquaticus]|uniref:Membrane fusion protein (MFP) family protein n=1 Tax=Rhodoferax aquaticus TaxID=2527691 RepID=A0A515ETT7_9BURK|nr:HlyD family type I secretion periplasmic adaptor subunit [Rhodoferax aquaticus]QDL56084.1 HlyD family type I secretion periplasmic adaptor subunit [Rhodoferax aquaticus]